jgi:recombination protein RecR
MSSAHAIESLKAALACLPGVGPKSAQRMAYYLIERDREGARAIATALTHALDLIQHCKRCNNLSETEICELCASPTRKHSQLCIVETPADLEAIEQTGTYKGCYFVLMGTISPLDGIGPDNIGVDRLLSVLDEYAIEEAILATNLTAEGETTAEYLTGLLGDRNLTLTRIARGVPVGGELEYIDRNTVARAIDERRAVHSGKNSAGGEQDGT